MAPLIVVQVVVDKPLAQGFDYLWDAEKLGMPPQVGCLVEVPFGRSSLIGIIVKVSAHSDFEIDKLKSVAKLAPLPPLDQAALRLMNFASQYYIYALGETIIPTIPQMWKKPENWEKIPQKLIAAEEKKKKKIQQETREGFISEDELNDEQQQALEKLRVSSNAEKNQFMAFLLQGQTGSGKTLAFGLPIISESAASPAVSEFTVFSSSPLRWRDGATLRGVGTRLRRTGTAGAGGASSTTGGGRSMAGGSGGARRDGARCAGGFGADASG